MLPPPEHPWRMAPAGESLLMTSDSILMGRDYPSSKPWKSFEGNNLQLELWPEMSWQSVLSINVCIFLEVNKPVVHLCLRSRPLPHSCQAHLLSEVRGPLKATRICFSSVRENFSSVKHSLCFCTSPLSRACLLTAKRKGQASESCRDTKGKQPPPWMGSSASQKPVIS